MKRAILCLVVLFTAGPASAQGVFNMGVLTNTVSQDAVRQSERRRAQRDYAPRPRPRQQASRMSKQEACYLIRNHPAAPYQSGYAAAMRGCRMAGL